MRAGLRDDAVARQHYERATDRSFEEVVSALVSVELVISKLETLVRSHRQLCTHKSLMLNGLR